MTAATTSTPRAERSPGRLAGLRGLAWVVWRQHRLTSWIALAAFLAFCAELLWLRSSMMSFIDANGLRAACESAAACERRGPAVGAFQHEYYDLLRLNGLLLTWLPLLFGMFVAGPVVARELETGTYKMAWTQSVSPARWFAAKLALPVVAALAGVSVLSALHTWTWRSVDSADSGALLVDWRWFDAFDALGTAPVAGSLAAIGLGALAGLLVKRVLPAMAGTAVAGVALYWPLAAVRPRLLSPETLLGRDVPALSDGDSWRFERGMVSATGRRLPEPDCVLLEKLEGTCLSRHNATGWYVDYHPAAHFWPLQGIHAGIVLAAAVALGAGTLWWMRRSYP
ncbi:translation initiation factor IF-2 [Streptomyces sp. HU2014]|uniref:translation initiation factor IF-2 n=1 Tax=Streptomyces sp. HU2014 TaxID=2939414 RepID=UPI00200D9415|nr:translation initiation factor IF-2 [Streptomyces sp. HU2014]UQI48490.1 translation initiation factor IF-2 [Streptomyces sp. HU2014]